MESSTPWWAREHLWRSVAVWITAAMFVVLIILSFDTLSKTSVGTERVPDFTVINHRIHYEFDAERNRQVPRIGAEKPLFGKLLSAAEAEALVTHGKKIVQGRNCMNCHTLLGNGAYYAPDLTKAWLDPGWGSEAVREQLMLAFLQDPAVNARTFGTGRRMPDLGLDEEEVKAIIAFLKWMSAIDTNGFPYNFTAIPQGE